MKSPLLTTNRFYIFGLMLTAAGMPLSMFVMSISQMVLAAAFFFEGNPIEKFKRFFSNKAAMVICGLLLLHVAGMLWTTNTEEGWKDIRVKLPLLVFTIIIAGSKPISRKQFQLVMAVFIGSLLTGTLLSLAVLLGFIEKDLKGDIRNIMLFNISHIRFSLMLCVAIFYLAYLIFRDKISAGIKAGLFILVLWFTAFLFILESLTGLGILFFVGFSALVYFSFRTGNTIIKALLLVAAVALPLLLFIQIQKKYEQFYTIKEYAFDNSTITSEGNPYFFDTLNNEIENGYKVWAFINENELQREWDRRSSFKYDSLDRQGQRVKYTLVRFLTSKGWKKDGDAVRQLSPDEVALIESGFTNAEYARVSSIQKRLYELVWEYDQIIHSGDPSQHSAMQRMEFWKAAVHIIKKHPITGVGTGDMPIAYKHAYTESGTRLNQKYWLRAHNQYLSIAVALGIPASLYFLFALIFPAFACGKIRNYFYVTFLLIALLSMFTEDTLETQAGATFFAFFNALLLFGVNYNTPDAEIARK